MRPIDADTLERMGYVLTRNYQKDKTTNVYETKKLSDVPSVELDRKGRWINNSPVTMKCDQCCYVIKDWRWNEFNFCPNCGADMRGDESEDT